MTKISPWGRKVLTQKLRINLAIFLPLTLTSDVVQAYKSLQKEKEALESTVKALSSNPSQDGRRKPRPNENSPKKVVDKEFAEKESDSNDENEGRIPVNEGDLYKVETDSSSKEDGNEGEDSLNQKISTLSKALATLTEEKSKMAAAFQNDRKFAIVSSYCILRLLYF